MLMARRVLIADDHSLFRDGVVTLLEAEGMEVVGEAADGEMAVELALKLKPDLVLLDIHMPKKNGLEALREIRDHLPDAQIVMLTVSDEDENLFEAVRHGAQGYLLKSLNSHGFLASLRGLERGEAALSRKLTQRLMAYVASASSVSGAREKSLGLEALSERELELLKLVALGYSNKLAAKELNVSANTVKYHMKNILRKLGVKNRAEAAAYAVTAGILDEP